MLQKKIREALLFTVILVAVVSSCEDKKPSYSEVKVSSAPHIITGIPGLERLSSCIKTDPGSRFSLKIVIYSYRLGKETISLSGDNGFITEAGKAEVKALVETLEGDRIIRADFIEVAGGSDDELIRNLAESVSALIQN